MTELFTDLEAEPASVRRGLWWRRATMTLLGAVVVAALAGTIGQRATTARSAGPAARVAVSAPERVRGGLLFQARVEVRALRAVDHPRLVLDRGWAEGLQVNTIEPGPAGEASRDGRLVLSYPALAAGDRLVVWFHFQSEPTSVGRRPFALELDDAQRPLARVARHLTVLP